MGKVFIKFPLNLIYFFSCLIPKDKNLWLFSAWNANQYSDNPKYVYKYVIQNCSETRAKWFTRNQEVFLRMRAQNLPVVFAWSIEGLKAQLFAGAVVFTHSVDWDFFPPFIGAQTKRIQTWHGMPIKKIGNDDQRDQNAKFKLKILRWLLPFRNERYDLVIAGSDIDKSIYITAFNVRPENISITGYPRNDAIISGFRCSRENQGKRRFIYMPTYRGHINSEFTLLGETNFNFKFADSFFKKLRAELHIKLHPVQVFKKADLEAMNFCRYIKPLLNNGDDIYETISSYDVLITDFSGIYFDFMITGRPIIMAPFNINNYLINDRNLYYSYEDICPDVPCANWEEVFERILSLTYSDQINGSRYFMLQRKFHHHMDSRSSERVVREIKRVLGGKGVAV